MGADDRSVVPPWLAPPWPLPLGDVHLVGELPDDVDLRQACPLAFARTGANRENGPEAYGLVQSKALAPGLFVGITPARV